MDPTQPLFSIEKFLIAPDCESDLHFWLWAIGVGYFWWKYGIYNPVKSLLRWRYEIREAHQTYLASLVYCDTMRAKWVAEYELLKAEGLEAERIVRQQERKRSETRTETRAVMGSTIPLVSQF